MARKARKKQSKDFKSKGSYMKDSGRNRGGKDGYVEEDRKMKQSDYLPGEVNDFDWYNHNPSLTVGAGSVQYPYRPGMVIPTSQYWATGIQKKCVIPGIMSISWIPTIGQSANNQSPISIAAREMYGRVRAAYSGTLRADAPDMMIYVQACDSVFAYISWLKRLYRMVNAQSPDNFVVPDGLLMSLGFTKPQCTELRVNKMKLFNAVNTLIGMTDKFRVPDVYPVLRRHVWMNDRVYTDASSLNAQLYIFDMKFVYQYALLNTPDSVLAGGLECVETPLTKGLSSTDIVTQLYEFGENMISKIAASETAYTISGYLERAYEGYPLFRMATLLIDERLDFTFNEVVMSQIENATLPSSLWGLKAGTNNVTQDPKTNALLCNPTVSSVPTSFQVPVINIHNDAPSIPDTVEATRLKCGIIDTTGAILCATEIVRRITVYVPASDGRAVFGYVLPSILQLNDTNLEDNFQYVQALYIASAFDWHPFSTIELSLAEQSAWTYQYGDIHDIGVLTPQELSELHRVCVLSEYNCFNGI